MAASVLVGVPDEVGVALVENVALNLVAAVKGDLLRVGDKAGVREAELALK